MNRNDNPLVSHYSGKRRKSAGGRKVMWKFHTLEYFLTGNIQSTYKVQRKGVLLTLRKVNTRRNAQEKRRCHGHNAKVNCIVG